MNPKELIGKTYNEAWKELGVAEYLAEKSILGGMAPRQILPGNDRDPTYSTQKREFDYAQGEQRIENEQDAQHAMYMAEAFQPDPNAGIPVARYEDKPSFWKKHPKLKKGLAVAIPLSIVGAAAIGILSEKYIEKGTSDELKMFGDIHGYGGVYYNISGKINSEVFNSLNKTIDDSRYLPYYLNCTWKGSPGHWRPLEPGDYRINVVGDDGYERGVTFYKNISYGDKKVNVTEADKLIDIDDWVLLNVFKGWEWEYFAIKIYKIKK